MEFWSMLWPNGWPHGLLLNVFALPERSSWYYEHAPNEELLKKLLDGADAYYGVGLSYKRPGRKSRFGADDIECIPGVWIDIDLKGQNTEEKIQQFLATQLPPSLVVHTGGGFHVYWLFDKPLLGHARVQAVLSGWKNYITEEAHKSGVQMDSQVIEPARVLRIPGFVNHKPGRENAIVRVVYYANDVKNDVTEIPVLEHPVDHRPPVATDGRITEGIRNDAIYRFCCYLRGVYGADNEQIYQLAHEFNRVMGDPPLAGREVELLARSAMRHRRVVQMGDKNAAAHEFMLSRFTDSANAKPAQ